jgi:integrase
MDYETSRAFPFTEARIEAAMQAVQRGDVTLDHTGRRWWRDAGDRHGLMVLVSKRGAAFYRVHKAKGKKQRVRIGDATTMRVSKAREVALKLAGGDRAAAPPPARVRTDGATVAQAWQAYFADASAGVFIAGRKPTAASTLKSYRELYEPHIKPKYGPKSLHALARDVRKLHEGFRNRPAAGNRLLQVVSNLFVHAARAGAWEGPNPTLDPITGRTIRKHPVASRSRWLTTAEAARVVAYAATEADPWKDFWPLLLLTGVRVSNLREMRWAHLDLRDRDSTWSIPMTKNGDPHIVALSAQAVEILRARLERAPKTEKTRKQSPKPLSPWVFPMREDPARCICDVDHAWERVREHAPLEGVRIHDLRRTGASWATQAGAPLPAVGRFIGDKSINATAVYARADTASARAVADIIDRRLREAQGMKS